MTNKLDNALNFHHQALNLTAARQVLLSSNVANADTPNFKARDIEFSSVLRGTLSSSSIIKAGLTATPPMHISLNSGDIASSAMAAQLNSSTAQCGD